VNLGSLNDPITFLFTDIEGSTRLWEEAPETMRRALAGHDALTRRCVEGKGGTVVKMTGDGVYAAFADPLHAVAATLQLQQALANFEATAGIALRVRAGLHAGTIEHRDGDFFGGTVNRAARIMGAAHGGQVLLSQAVVEQVANRLPEGVSLRDLGAVRLKDLSRPERVYQLVEPGLRRDFPALRSLEATPNNLPSQVSSFVGRERELGELKVLLANARMVTLLGVGGLGKSRLSLQVGAEVLDDYPNGVWFVEFAPLTDGRYVAQAVASVLGVKEESGRPVIEALAKHVEDRCLLLILDNCEHLGHACADLAKRLLLAGSQLKVVATSREPLRVVGETTYALPILAIPASREMRAAGVIQYDAARLFIERAMTAQPAFRITDVNAGAVADICRRLDGIPLALELAAARVRTLSVDAIAARLTDRFRLLTRGDQTALPRQQTLRACIDWSHELLADPERALFRRLAVFAGGFTLEAAESIGASGEVVESDVLDLLSRLVEKSLVELMPSGEHYTMLETVRQYAQLQLDRSDEGSLARARHLAFFVALAEEAQPNLLGAAQGVWLARLDHERENLLAACAWCDSADNGAELGRRLTAATHLYWWSRGLTELGFWLTLGALGRTGASLEGMPHRRALYCAANFGIFIGRYADAEGWAQDLLAIARRLGDTDRIAGALTLLGRASAGQGKLSAARGQFEESLAVARNRGDKVRMINALGSLADLHRADGELDVAEAEYEEIVRLARAAGNRSNLANSLLCLARVSIARRSAERARVLIIEVLPIVDEITSKPEGQGVLEASAALAALVGAPTRAVRFFGAAQTQATAMGHRRDPSDEDFLASQLAPARQALGDAEFNAAEIGGRALAYDAAMAEARAWLEALSCR
jgi:predicted ATPase/class 3 adenylate cyclase